MRHPIDWLVEQFSPQLALKRRAARGALAYYEAAEPSRLRKFRRDTSSPNTQVQQGAVPLRTQIRHLEQNHDIARGALRVLVNNVVGPAGIGIEPQPRIANGDIHADYAKALLEAWRDWCRKPEVTQQHHFARVQRLMARTWLRDGESLAQQLIGPVALLDHGTRVPYSLELLEPDMVPLDYFDDARRIKQGIECNAWGRPVAYHVYKDNPGEAVTTKPNLKRVPADRMLRLTCIDRIGQLRGVSEFASVITRLEDLKDYEESERVAAKIAAMLTAYVKRGTPDLYDPAQATRDTEGNLLPREMRFQPGMFIDSLLPGEEIGLIDSKRPNPNVVTWRQGQLRAFATGIGASYSSVSRDYSGTYSSQRQELVEQWSNYATLTDEFTGQFVRPVWEAFVLTAHLSGVVPRPRAVLPDTADDALYIGTSMPWIDPLKEAVAFTHLVRAGFASEVEVIRKRGGTPSNVLEQIKKWRQYADENNLMFDSDARRTSQAGTAQDYLRESVNNNNNGGTNGAGD
jgi:lambda family phage portal protein